MSGNLRNCRDGRRRRWPGPERRRGASVVRCERRGSRGRRSPGGLRVDRDAREHELVQMHVEAIRNSATLPPVRRAMHPRPSSPGPQNPPYACHNTQNPITSRHRPTRPHLRHRLDRRTYRPHVRIPRPTSPTLALRVLRRIRPEVGRSQGAGPTRSSASQPGPLRVTLLFQVKGPG